MSQLRVHSKNHWQSNIFEERRMSERDQQKWSPVLRSIALPFFKRSA
jgi:hypothetical protein